MPGEVTKLSKMDADQTGRLKNEGFSVREVLVTITAECHRRR